MKPLHGILMALGLAVVTACSGTSAPAAAPTTPPSTAATPTTLSREQADWCETIERTNREIAALEADIEAGRLRGSKALDRHAEIVGDRLEMAPAEIRPAMLVIYEQATDDKTEDERTTGQKQDKERANQIVNAYTTRTCPS